MNLHDSWIFPDISSSHPLPTEVISVFNNKVYNMMVLVASTLLTELSHGLLVVFAEKQNVTVVFCRLCGGRKETR